MVRFSVDEDDFKRWVIDIGGMQYLGEGNFTIPIAGAKGLHWARPSIQDMIEKQFHRPKRKKKGSQYFPFWDARALEHNAREERARMILEGIKPQSIELASKAYVKYVSEIVQAYVHKMVRYRSLERIAFHGYIYPVKKLIEPIPPTETPLEEDRLTIKSLDFPHLPGSQLLKLRNLYSLCGGLCT